VQADRGGIAAGRDQVVGGSLVTGARATVADRGGRVGTVQHFHGPVTIVNVQRYEDGLPQAEVEVRDHFQEGQRLQSAQRHEAAIREFEKAFAAAENDNQRCALHILIGNSFAQLDELKVAEGHYHEALSAAQRGRDREGEARALGNLGNVDFYRGDLDKAEEHYGQALAAFEQMGNQDWRAALVGNLGNVYLDRGDLEKAEEYYEQALASFEQIGNQGWRAAVICNLGNVYFKRGDLHKAEESHRKALAIDEEIGNKIGQASTLTNLVITADTASWARPRVRSPRHRRGRAVGGSQRPDQPGLWPSSSASRRGARVAHTAKALYEAIGGGGEGPENVRAALERLGAAAPAPPAARLKTSPKRRPRKKR
jgi:tetratricopeptide (TPR) repeat protein